jgi:hypothetical protein
MAKAYPPEELAARIFYISIAGVLSFVAAVFMFIL